MMATSSPIAIGFGAAFLGEIFSLRIYLGIVLILLAVLNLGLFDIKEDQGRNRFEVVVGVAWVGICIALVRASGGSRHVSQNPGPSRDAGSARHGA